MKQNLITRESGFTLIEVLVVVIIVAILAAISVPIYIQYVQGARASDAQASIGAIYNAVKMYRQDLGLDPSSVEELEELEKRLKIRGTETPDKIAERLSKAENELKKASEFDKVVVNDNLPHALKDTEQLVRDFLNPPV